jgi:two-component system LytT family sensor kinase
MKFFYGENNTIPYFWPIHILTWVAYTLIDLSINLYRFTDFADYLVWFDSNLMGFIIVTALRYVYRKLFGRDTVYFKQVAIVLLLSTIGGCIWFFLRGFSHVLFFPNKAISFSNYYQNFAVPFGLAGSVFWLVGPIFGWSLGYLSIKYYFFLVEEKNRNQKMLLLAKNAELQMLRYQINPHFLFNSLNSVKALISENQEAAENTVTALSEFLQATLKYNDRLMIPVEEEMDIIKKYLSVEKIRYEERLNYSIEADKNILKYEVPCFITQPLVENAIKHGLSGSPDEITLAVKYHSETGNEILIEVVNTGQLKESWSFGVGLGNMLERLENSYPGKFRFSLKQIDNNVVASIIIKSEK